VVAKTLNESDAQLDRTALVFDWKNPLFRFGIALTALWLVSGILILAIGAQWHGGLRPGEWANVFSGLFAPVAFLWLVLGFVQQGQELKLSTQALMLQVEELKNTVQHQGELVAISRQQVDAQLRQLLADEDARRQATLPKLILTQSGGSSGPQGINYNMFLANAGAAATNVRVSFEPKHNGNDVLIPTIGSGERKTFIVNYKTKPSAVVALVRFIDLAGNPGEVRYNGNLDSGNITFHMKVAAEK
jgi:hypothetical protein